MVRYGDEVKGVFKFTITKDREARPKFVAFFGAKKKFEVTLRSSDSRYELHPTTLRQPFFGKVDISGMASLFDSQ